MSFQIPTRSVLNGTITPMERTPPDERSLLRLAQDRVREQLPERWSVQINSERERSAVDAVIEVVPPDAPAICFQLEVKTLLNARDVPRLAAQMGDQVRPMVAARYLSPQTRDALTAAGFSYLDATGNLRLVSDSPPLFASASGADRDPWRSSDRPTNTLKGIPAARIVRALTDVQGTWRIRELAQFAQTSLGSTSRTVDYLDREALVVRDDSGAIVEVDWESLVRRWAADYALLRSSQIARCIAPRPEDALAGVRDLGEPYVITGSLAARRWTPTAEATVAVVLVEEPEATADVLGLRRAAGTANVLLIRPFDNIVYERAATEDGLRYAAPAQVLVDLMTGPGRNPSEAEILLDWMRRDESRWRPSR